jgi:recombination DNA repair RAD52 pathway protein
LSAAFDFGVALDFFRTVQKLNQEQKQEQNQNQNQEQNQNQDQHQKQRTGVSAPHKKVLPQKHKTELIRCTEITDNFLVEAIQ